MVAKMQGGQSDLVQVIRRVGRKAQSVTTVGQLSLIVKKIKHQREYASGSIDVLSDDPVLYLGIPFPCPRLCE